MKNDIWPPEASLPEDVAKSLDQVRKNVCQNVGHDFACSTYFINRDGHGVSFIGDGGKAAAKFQVWICRKCALSIEIPIAPKAEVRTGKPPAKAPEAIRV